MSLRKGDHLVIKREGKILTPDAGEAYHEFEVMAIPQPEPPPGGYVFGDFAPDEVWFGDSAMEIRPLIKIKVVK